MKSVCSHARAPPLLDVLLYSSSKSSEESHSNTSYSGIGSLLEAPKTTNSPKASTVSRDNMSLKTFSTKEALLSREMSWVISDINSTLKTQSELFSMTDKSYKHSCYCQTILADHMTKTAPLLQEPSTSTQVPLGTIEHTSTTSKTGGRSTQQVPPEQKDIRTWMTLPICGQISPPISPSAPMIVPNNTIPSFRLRESRKARNPSIHCDVRTLKS